MPLLSLLHEHASLLLVLFGAGCLVSYIREFRPLPTKTKRLLGFVETALLLPGLAGLFITAQEFSIRFFALFPAATIAAFVLIIALAASLLVAKKRQRSRPLAWLGGLLGLPGLVFPLVLLAFFLSSPQQLAELRDTYAQLESTPGQTAPDFSFTLLPGGETRSLADYRGQLVLLNIWATWCAPCRREMPALDRLQQKHRRAGLVVLHLSDEPPDLLTTWIARHPASTTHARIGRAQMPEFYRFGSARPTSFLIDRDGRVLTSVIGAKDFDFFDAALAPHL